MPRKVSSYKATRIAQLYFKGYSQPEIANKLGIDQSTVSLYLGRLKYLVKQKGLDAVAKQSGLAEPVESLHELAIDLKAGKLTAADAKAGLKMRVTLEHLGIPEESYEDVLLACLKMEAKGFAAAAAELGKLEKSTGLTFKALAARYTSTQQQLKKAQDDLQAATGAVKVVREQLAGIAAQKKLAGQDLNACMDKAGVDMNRLKLVEDLALFLKKAGIPNNKLQQYIGRQQALDKVGLSLDAFTGIVEKAQVATAHDGGKALILGLSEYGGLANSIKGMQAKLESLGKQAEGLEQRATVKREVEAAISNLEKQEAGLKTSVSELSVQEARLKQAKEEADSLKSQKSRLWMDVDTLEALRQVRHSEVMAEEKKLADLGELKKEHDRVQASLAEYKAKEDQAKTQWDVFQKFLGMINPTSLPPLEQFALALPRLLAGVEQGKYRPDAVWSVLLNSLAGGALQVLQCTSCRARFVVDRVSKYGCCPNCASSSTYVGKSALAILQGELSGPKQEQKPAPPQLGPVLTKPAPEEKGNGSIQG